MPCSKAPQRQVREEGVTATPGSGTQLDCNLWADADTLHTESTLQALVGTVT